MAAAKSVWFRSIHSPVATPPIAWSAGKLSTSLKSNVHRKSRKSFPAVTISPRYNVMWILINIAAKVSVAHNYPVGINVPAAARIAGRNRNRRRTANQRPRTSSTTRLVSFLAEEATLLVTMPAKHPATLDRIVRIVISPVKSAVFTHIVPISAQSLVLLVQYLALGIVNTSPSPATCPAQYLATSSPAQSAATSSFCVGINAPASAEKPARSPSSVSSVRRMRFLIRYWTSLCSPATGIWI